MPSLGLGDANFDDTNFGLNWLAFVDKHKRIAKKSQMVETEPNWKENSLVELNQFLGERCGKASLLCFKVSVLSFCWYKKE